LGIALQSRVAPYLTHDLNPGDETTVPSQPCRAKVAKIPEYFAEFRDKWDILAPFLGSEIIAKVRFLLTSMGQWREASESNSSPFLQLSFGDSSGKNYVSKAGYIEKGPPALLELAPTLL
jgi:actin-related protein 9